MIKTDLVHKNTSVPQQNNYSGVKISIHNPSVNIQAPQNGYAQPDFKIYDYDKKPEYTYQPPFVVTKPTPETPKTVSLPEPQTVKELPQSVLTNIKIPEPVYVEDVVQEPLNVIDENQTNSVSTNIIEEPELVLNAVPEVENAPEIPFTATVEELPEQKNEITSTEIKPEQEVVTQTETVTPTELNEIKKSPIEIIPPANNNAQIIDYEKVTKNLKSENYDIQALQLRDIAFSAMPESEIPLKKYITEQNFLDVIDIVNKDASALAGPTEAQTQIRTKIIENYIAKLNQEKANVSEKDIVYPHQLSEQDINYANALAPRELAERNREYAITALAMMTKEFMTQVEEKSGTTVPITDVPGMSALVNSLKNEHFVIRIAALNALGYLQKPEYVNELKPIYIALINTDADENVRQLASETLKMLEASVDSQPVTNAA